MEDTRYTFTLEARDVPGMLVRITQVFARRGCNIQSLHVRPYKHDQWAVIDIAAYGIPRPEQLTYQLEKLVDVHSAVVHEHAVKG